ncbi:MAG: DUF1570 domain-containing protein [Phycisphaerales bacterium]|nr:DUF1570 domain-containing protein [Phycisphaerales bacterium]MCB9840799.1 DUF1570 domain-containing protein [Phycisphaeraceae bacterium]
MHARSRFLVATLALGVGGASGAVAPARAAHNAAGLAHAAPGFQPRGDRQPPALSTFQSRHYEVAHNIDARDARAIAHHMDLVFDEYERRLSSFGTRNARRIRLYLLDSYDDYLAHLAASEVNGMGTGGIFFVRGGEAGLATYADGQTRRRMLGVLQHEGFHQFAFVRISSDLPPWVNEGLAEYFEQAVLVRTRFRIGQASRSKIERLQRAIEQGQTFSFEAMLAMGSSEWGGRVNASDPRAGTMYDQAWSMVHFLIHARNGRFASMFESYLRALSQGLQRDQAFERAFGTDDIASFEEAWREYVLELEPDPLSTVVDNLEMLTPMILELHGRAERPATVGELQEMLAASGLVIRRFDAGFVREVRASDPSLFEVPEPERQTRPIAIEPIPPRNGEPLGLEVRGLEATVRLVWRRDGEAWVGEIEFR